MPSILVYEQNNIVNSVRDENWIAVIASNGASNIKYLRHKNVSISTFLHIIICIWS